MLDKNNMEEFFKNKNQEHNHSYNPQAWADMEKMLDKDDRKKGAFWWWFGGGTAICFVFLYFGYQLLSNSSQERIPADDLNDLLGNELSVSTENNFNNVTELASVNSIDHVESDQQSIVPQANDISSSKPSDSFANIEKYDATHVNSSVVLNTNTNSQNIIEQEVEISSTDAAIGDNNTLVENPYGSANHQEITNGSDLNKPNAPSLSNSVLSYIGLKSISPFIVGSRRHRLPEIDTSYSSVQQTKHIWMISAAIAIESSATDDYAWEDADYKLGVKVAYGISNKLSLFTGIGLVDDLYFTTADKYNVREGYWLKSTAPNQIKAQCQMLEVPIGIRYAFSGIESSGWSARLQANSIFMLRETYYYGYEVPDPELRQNWMGTNSSTDLFSTISLGFGYNHWITPSVGLGISPYITTGVSGIGHGNVLLNSFGLEFNVSFK